MFPQKLEMLKHVEQGRNNENLPSTPTGITFKDLLLNPLQGPLPEKGKTEMRFEKRSRTLKIFRKLVLKPLEKELTLTG